MEEKDKKELNLTEVLSIIWKWILSCIKACWNFALWCIRFLYKHKWATIICFCIGIAYGIFSNRCLDPYQSGFYLISYSRSPYYPIEYTNSIGDLCGKPGNAFGKELGLDSLTASAVKGMNAYYVVDIKGNNTPDFPDYDKKYAKDTLINIWSQRYFYVELLTDNQEVVPIVKESLVKKLCEYPALKDSWEITCSNYEEWIKSYQEEIVKYDSVQAKMYRNIGEQKGYSLSGNGSGSGLRLLGEEKVQIFQGERQQLMNQILGIQQELEELSSGAIGSKLPIIYSDKNLIKSIIKYVILVIVLEMAVLLIADNRKKLKEFLQPTDK